jgi:hypothetical protein
LAGERIATRIRITTMPSGLRNGKVMLVALASRLLAAVVEPSADRC